MDLLQSINFEFEDQRARIKPHWMKSYELLKKHFEEHGNLVMDLANPAQAALQNFIERQGILSRKLQENDDRGADGSYSIVDKKIKLLRAINFDFHTLSPKINPSWMATYGMLREHFQKHGGYATLQYKMPLDRKLMHFIWDQRGMYKKVHANREPGQEMDPVNKEKFKLLEEIQFEFESKKRVKPKSENGIAPNWMNHYMTLKAFFDRHGTLDGVDAAEGSGQGLQKFLQEQRRTYRTFYKNIGKAGFANLDPSFQEKFTLLQELNFLFEDDKWEKKFAELEEFMQQHGHCRVPQGHPLYNWIRGLRYDYSLMEKGEPSGMDATKYLRLTNLGLELEAGETYSWGEEPAWSSPKVASVSADVA